MRPPSHPIPVDTASIACASRMLKAGKLVAFPTETVYGLGADATQDHAVASIYAAKGRPQFNPLIVHVAHQDQLDSLVIWNDKARLLAQAFWPGPLTLVLQRQKDCSVSLLASAGMDTLAVRIPSHPTAQWLLRDCQLPIAAPSANSSGKLSPTTAQHVDESLGSKVDLILDGGPCSVGIESTIIDTTSPIVTLLRPGSITQEQIGSIVGITTRATTMSPVTAPGMLASHYAPNLPLRLNAFDVNKNEALLAFGDDKKILGGKTRLNLSPQGDLKEAAAHLFSMLRQLDQSGSSGIAVMPIKEEGLGLAINDRLQRASTRN